MKKFFSLLLAEGVLLLAGCSNYDAGTADAPANRKGFQRHLGVEAGSAVRKVYFYADEWSADVQYQLAFKAPPEVVAAIVEKLALQKKDRPKSVIFREMPWWREDFTRSASEYYGNQPVGRELHRHLWYDPGTMTCQYLSFSL